MSQIFIHEAGPLLETSKFITESEAIMAAVDPDAHVSPLINGHQFKPNGEHESSGKWETILGDTYIEGEPHSTQLLIKFPGFIEKAVAKARRRSPRGQLHITID